MNIIQIYDTTLRDGMQGVGVNFTLTDKIQIAHKLDEMKLDYIEGGFPLASEKESAFFRKIKKEKFSHSKITAFGSTKKPGIKAEKDSHLQALLTAETPAVTIVGKTWKAHVERVIGTDVDENLQMIFDSIHFIKSKGIEVLFDLEHFFDGYKDDPDYALRVLKTGSEAGADALILCDTNGGFLPDAIEDVFKKLSQEKLSPLGCHFHNDCGTAVANSLSAIKNGAVQVQGTINGWGERCGNTNLCILVPNMSFKTKFKTNMDNQLINITSLSRFAAEKANIIPEKRQPYVGEAAFSHKAGQHADVIAKAPELMEHVNGALVGNERRILLSELAGKSTIVKKLSKYGNYEKKSDLVKKIIHALKTKEARGYEFEAAEASFDLLMRKEIGLFTPLFELDNYHLESYKTWTNPSKTIGRVFLNSMGKKHMGAAVGVGPVGTLDHAIRDALKTFHPFIESICLIDYRVRVLNPEEASEAKVRVFITSTDHKNVWDTVGVSENIVEASWEALVDSIDYYYNNFIL